MYVWYVTSKWCRYQSHLLGEGRGKLYNLIPNTLYIHIHNILCTIKHKYSQYSGAEVQN